MLQQLIQRGFDCLIRLLLAFHEVIQCPSYAIHFSCRSILTGLQWISDIHHPYFTCELGSSQSSPQLGSQANLPPPKTRIQPWNFTQELGLQSELESVLHLRLPVMIQQQLRNFTRKQYPATLVVDELTNFGEKWGCSSRIRVGGRDFRQVSCNLQSPRRLD